MASSSEKITADIIRDLCSGDSKRRTLVLTNGKRYPIIVDEVVKRSEFFASMFREGRFVESHCSQEQGEAKEADAKTDDIQIRLPFEGHFDPLYIYLMTGVQTNELTGTKGFVQTVMNSDYLHCTEVQALLMKKLESSTRFKCEVLRDSGEAWTILPRRYLLLIGKEISVFLANFDLPEGEIKVPTMVPLKMFIQGTNNEHHHYPPIRKYVIQSSRFVKALNRIKR